MEDLVIVRGGGDIATGTIYKLVKSGFHVLILEITHPSAIRRNVAFSEAVYEGKWQVEDMTCYLANDMKEAKQIMQTGSPALMIDPKGEMIEKLKPIAVVDAILAKKNLGTTRDMAPITIALGPGFTAGKDVDVVVETMRGHRLGRIMKEGSAIPNTGIPGVIKGFGKERVIHSPAEGILRNICHITDMVTKGQILAKIETPDGEIIDVPASMDGLLRGFIRDGYPVTKGFKIADIDPRAEEYDNCFTISDKARCIAGGVLEALLYLKNNLTADQKIEDSKSIYADYAATHITKPDCVKDAMIHALSLGNSGRGVNESSLDAARKIYEVRTKVDLFFDGYGPEQVVFTSGITESLNTVIKGYLNKGDHVITTFMEHNSVLRPLYEMEQQGVRLTITSPDVDHIEQAIYEDTKMVVMIQASNVTGEVFDIRSVGKLCKEKGILFVVDTAQSAGVIPISMKEDYIDVLCFTGHKGLMGPQGIGGICIRKGVKIHPLKTGGTGILSFSKTQPEALPQALEAGTLNGIGIAGLGAAIDHINTYGINKIRKQEKNLIETFYKKMKEIKGIKTYHENPLDFKKQTAICSINLEEYDSGSVSDELMERFHIQTRSGAHCAPLVHEHFGTVEQGMVRFSFGHETTIEEINQIIHAVKILAEE